MLRIAHALEAQLRAAMARAFPEAAAAAEAGGKPLDPQLAPASKPEFGDFQANGALPLAKPLGQPPRVIATAIEAVNIARKFSTPVIILTDQGIASRIEAFREPDLQKLMQDITPDLSPVADHKPYDLSVPDGVTRHLAPGTRVASGKYPVVTGLEHDELGHPTGSPKLHVAMVAKRRNKLRRLAEELPVPTVFGPSEGQVLLVSWGSSQGPVQEAVKVARSKGQAISALHIKHLNPLPNGLEKVFDAFRHVLVVELNDEGFYGYGQLASVLRGRYADARIGSITKTDGLTWKVREILDRAAALTAR